MPFIDPDPIVAELNKRSADFAAGRSLEFGQLFIELPEYTCHKRVRAAKIVIAENRRRSDAPIIVADFVIDLILTLDVDGTNMTHVAAANSPLRYKELADIVGGYLVIYSDGYESWSPAKAFEEGYTLTK